MSNIDINYMYDYTSKCSIVITCLIFHLKEHLEYLLTMSIYLYMYIPPLQAQWFIFLPFISLKIYYL